MLVWVHAMDKVDMSKVDFQTWLATLSPEDHERFLKIMRDEKTYLAEDMNDVIAILGQIREEKKKH